MRGEQLPAHVGRRLELGIGARAGRAQEIAAVGGLEIDADRQPLRLLAAPGIDALEIAPRIDRLPGGDFGHDASLSTPCATARAGCEDRRSPADRPSRRPCWARGTASAPDRASRLRTIPRAAGAAPATSSTSYQAGRRCTSRPISRARSSVCVRHALGAPVDVVEQPPVRLLEAEQVIAAVGRGTEHGAVARPRRAPRRSRPAAPSARSGCRN